MRREGLIPVSAALLSVALMSVAAPAAAANGAQHCVLAPLAELKVVMTNRQPLVVAKINGADAFLLADSGAFYSIMSRAVAARYHIAITAAPFGMAIEGVGGERNVQIASVKSLEFSGIKLHDIVFLAGGSDIGADVAGTLGQNVLGLRDVDYDLAHGSIRLIETHDCGSKPMVFWTTTQPYSSIDRLDPDNEATPFTAVEVKVNGQTLKAEFDTGASSSFITRSGAQKAHIDLGGPDARTLGYGAGFGSRPVQEWVVPVDRFKIGDEEIRHTHMIVGASTLGDVDMLIGADFFLSHHIFVSNEQHKVYFTYNGGPVFSLPREQAAAAPAAEPQDATPKDAEGLALRGAASATRHDYASAIADLSQAITLAPAEGRYLRQRGEAYAAIGKRDLAMADLNEDLRRNPDDVPGLMFRARLHLDAEDSKAAVADLDRVDHLAAQEANIRLELGLLYYHADVAEAALRQYDVWIIAHPDDGQQAEARARRCWTRAFYGLEPVKGLADCEAAFKLLPGVPFILADRGLAHLRLGDLDKAIADYSAALAKEPKDAWSLYGRGVAERRRGLAAQADADIKAAIALEPKLPEQFKAHGMDS